MNPSDEDVLIRGGRGVGGVPVQLVHAARWLMKSANGRQASERSRLSLKIPRRIGIGQRLIGRVRFTRRGFPVGQR